MLTKLPEPALASDLYQPDSAAEEGAPASTHGADTSPAPPAALPPVRAEQARASSPPRPSSINPLAKKAKLGKSRAEYYRQYHLARKVKLQTILDEKRKLREMAAKLNTPSPLEVAPSKLTEEQRAQLKELGADPRLPALLNAVIHHNINLKSAAIALGMGYEQAKSLMKRAKQRARKKNIAWMLDTIGVPKAAALVVEKIDAGDKLVALELLKGRGHLRTHTAVKQEGGAAQMALAVKIEMPSPGHATPTITAGAIVGAPHTEAAPPEP